MKISKLIEKLKEAQEQYGDLNCCVYGGECYFDIDYIEPMYTWRDSCGELYAIELK